MLTEFPCTIDILIPQPRSLQTSYNICHFGMCFWGKHRVFLHQHKMWGNTGNGSSNFATRYAISVSFSSFSLTSCGIVWRQQGNGGSSGFAFNRRASFALTCPFDLAWLLSDSILKFSHPVTKLEPEFDRLGHSKHLLQNILPSRFKGHGYNFFQSSKVRLLDFFFLLLIYLLTIYNKLQNNTMYSTVYMLCFKRTAIGISISF